MDREELLLQAFEIFDIPAPTASSRSGSNVHASSRSSSNVHASTPSSNVHKLSGFCNPKAIALVLQAYGAKPFSQTEGDDFVTDAEEHLDARTGLLNYRKFVAEVLLRRPTSTRR